MGKALLRSYWTDREPKKYNSELHKQSCSWNMVPAGKNYLFAAIAQALHSQWWLAQSPEALWIILECFLSWGLGFGKACGSELKLIWNQCVSCTNTYVCICIYLCIWACVLNLYLQRCAQAWSQHRKWDSVQLPLIGSTSLVKQDQVPSTPSFTNEFVWAFSF